MMFHVLPGPIGIWWRKAWQPGIVEPSSFLGHWRMQNEQVEFVFGSVEFSRGLLLGGT